jgi:hypothetical protein
MIKFLLDTLNNCNTIKAKYIKSLYYKYCQYLYNEVNDSIYNNEEIFDIFLGELDNLHIKTILEDQYGEISHYHLTVNNYQFFSFYLNKTNEQNIKELHHLIKWNELDKNY